MTPPKGSANDRNTPEYDLSEVQRVAHLAAVGRRRASRHVSERLGVEDPVAEAIARKKLLALDPGKFVQRVVLPFVPPICADVYGLRDEDGSWYIKFHMEHGRVTIISCHGPEHDLTCIDGTIIKEQQP